MELNSIPSRIEVEGKFETGKQYDLEIVIDEDERDVIYGIVKDCFGDPIEDAVVKLLEIEWCNQMKSHKPVTHTFTNKDGEFLFGPLCKHKNYEIQIWGNEVKHQKVCKKCKAGGECLKGLKQECKACMPE